MATDVNVFRGRPDRNLFLVAAIAFPLLVLAGYFKSYYFSAFFDVRPLSNGLVHVHAVVMTAWVVYFVAQVWLVRSKNVRLHMTLGMAGIALASLVVVVGLLTAYDSHIVCRTAPPGVHPYGIALVALFDMVIFALLFSWAILRRKHAVEHKGLMLLTAVNFLPAVFFRLSPVPEKLTILWAYGMPDLIALGCLAWLSFKHRRVNGGVAAATFCLIASQPLRVYLAGTPAWMQIAGWIASL